MSVRLEIVSAWMAALKAAVPAGWTIHRHAMRPIEKDKLPAIVPYILICKLDPAAPPRQGLRRYLLEVRTEIRTTGREIDVALDPMVSLVQRVALYEPYFSDLVLKVDEGEAQYDALEADHSYVSAALDHTFTFYDDPTQQGPEPWNPTEGLPIKEVHVC